MNTATKSASALNMGLGEIFNTDLKLVEPENNHQENFEWFRSEITKALTADGFYRLTYPTALANCLDDQDIVNATFDGKNIEAMHHQLMTTKNEFDVIPLRRTVRALAIAALADEWATTEAANAGSK